MLAFLSLSLFALFSSPALAAPLFGLSIFGSDDQNKPATDPTTPLSLQDAQARFTRPAQFARVAYCSSASITTWKCGEPCLALKNISFLQSGGDEGLIPLYFIAHDKNEETIVVAHEGTDSKNVLSILNDAKFGLVDLNTTRFPDFAGKGIKVHSGFQQTFERTADGLLAGVIKALNDTGAKKVSVTGHSLGAAVATMTGLFIKTKVDPSVKVTVTGFGLPRGGNQKWANLLDTELGVAYMSNKNDPVPNVPPRFLGFQHSGGETHIIGDQQNFVACPGQDNNNCATGNSLLKSEVSDHKGPYLDGIEFGHGACPDGQPGANPAPPPPANPPPPPANPPPPPASPSPAPPVAPAPPVENPPADGENQTNEDSGTETVEAPPAPPVETLPADGETQTDEDSGTETVDGTETSDQTQTADDGNEGEDLEDVDDLF